METSDLDTYSHLGMDEINAPTLVDTVTDTLKRSILAGKFSPGERLYEAALARELGVSRGPIREALALLEGDGLVDNVPRRGKFISQLDSRTIDEIYSLRRILEPYAAELLIESLSSEAEEAIQKSADELNDIVEFGEAGQIAERDIAFHSLMYSLANHKPLARTWDEIIASKLRMLVNVTTLTHEHSDPGKNHQAIVDAILSRDVEKTRLQIIEHIEDAWQRAKTSLSESEKS